MCWIALKHGILRTPLAAAFDPTSQPHLLRDDLHTDSVHGDFMEPVTNLRSGLCPGKQYHIIGITHSAQHYRADYRRERIAPTVHPLAAQPVFETCLRIPTYVLLTGGVSRGLARISFNDLLPSMVARRITKGSAMAYYQALVRRNMRAIRDYLLDGALVRQRLLDRAKLDAYLVDEQPFLTVQPGQLINYVACEAWLTQVTSRK